MIERVQLDYFKCLFDHLEQVFFKGVWELEELFASNPVEEWKMDFSERMHFESCVTDYITRQVMD